MTRNSRMPDSLAADLDAECSACLAGARRLSELFDRYGVEAVEACFEAILAGSTEVYRRENLSPNPHGPYAVGEHGGDHGGGEAPPPRQRHPLNQEPAEDGPLRLDLNRSRPHGMG